MCHELGQQPDGDDRPVRLASRALLKCHPAVPIPLHQHTRLPFGVGQWLPERPGPGLVERCHASRPLLSGVNPGLNGRHICDILYNGNRHLPSEGQLLPSELSVRPPAHHDTGGAGLGGGHNGGRARRPEHLSLPVVDHIGLSYSVRPVVHVHGHRQLPGHGLTGHLRPVLHQVSHRLRSAPHLVSGHCLSYRSACLQLRAGVLQRQTTSQSVARISSVCVGYVIVVPLCSSLANLIEQANYRQRNRLGRGYFWYTP